LVVGQICEITGGSASWHVNFSPVGGTSSAGVVDGVEIFTGTAGPLGLWRPSSFTFTASADSATLRLRAEINGTDNDFAVDNIGITPVPAPGALGLLAAAGLVAGRRRRPEAPRH